MRLGVFLHRCWKPPPRSDTTLQIIAGIVDPLPSSAACHDISLIFTKLRRLMGFLPTLHIRPPALHVPLPSSHSPLLPPSSPFFLPFLPAPPLLLPP